ncbi:hypothetical protein [Streptomyces sp. NPDC008092]|uniref:hypothetical protein n=1 Tax=Streptomyces sp. NPDC008092 TaxID=3364808 RepID=UPI0036EBE3D0
MGRMAVSPSRRRGVLAAAGTATAGLALAAWSLLAGSGAAPSAPAPVSHVDTATRACLLTATDAGTDTTGTWAALGQVARADSGHLIVQSYRMPTGVKPAAYVNSLIRMGCSTVVTTDDRARSAVAARLAERPVPKVRFVVVGGRPLTGATHLSPDAVSVRALARVVTGAAAR